MSSEPEDYKKEYIKDLKAIKKEIEGIRNNSWGYWSRGMDLAVEAIDVAISDIRKDKRDGALVMFSSDNLKYPTTKKEAAIRRWQKAGGLSAEDKENLEWNTKGEHMPKITDLFPETNPKLNGGKEVIIGKPYPLLPNSKGEWHPYGDKNVIYWSFKVFVGNEEPQKEYYLHVYDDGSCELVDEEGMVDPEHDASADADQTDKAYDRERDRRMEEA